MLSDGGIDLDELTTIFAKIGRKLSTKEIEKFNKLDKNKNGKIEKYELGSVGEARVPPFWLGALGFAVAVVGFITSAVVAG